MFAIWLTFLTCLFTNIWSKIQRNFEVDPLNRVNFRETAFSYDRSVYFFGFYGFAKLHFKIMAFRCFLQIKNCQLQLICWIINSNEWVSPFYALIFVFLVGIKSNDLAVLVFIWHWPAEGIGSLVFTTSIWPFQI